MFSQRLKELRKAKGVTQSEVAELLKVPIRTYGSWERAEREPDLQTLCQIADAFHVSVDYLLGREPITVEKKQSLPEQPAEGRERIEFAVSKDMAGDTRTLEEYIRTIVRNEMNK